MTKRTNRLDDATDRLRSLVVRRAPGERLPTEHELAEELGVGRSTVREAVSRLVALDLIRVVHGRGMYVGEGAAAQTAEAADGEDALAALLGRAGALAHGRGMSARQCADLARDGFLASGAGSAQAPATLVGPLPSSALAEAVGLLQSAGVAWAERTPDELGPRAPAGLLVARWDIAKALFDDGRDVVPIASALGVDLMIAFASLAPGDRLLAFAPDKPTLTAIEQTARGLRPDLQLSGRVGPPGLAELGETAALVPSELAADLDAPLTFAYRSGLSEAERHGLSRALRHDYGEPATTGSRASAASSSGTASSQTLD